MKFVLKDTNGLGPIECTCIRGQIKDLVFIGKELYWMADIDDMLWIKLEHVEEKQVFVLEGSFCLNLNAVVGVLRTHFTG